MNDVTFVSLQLAKYITYETMWVTSAPGVLSKSFVNYTTEAKTPLYILMVKNYVIIISVDKSSFVETLIPNLYFK